MIAEGESAVEVVDSSVVIPIYVNREFNLASSVRQTATKHVTEALPSNAAPPNVAACAERIVARGDADICHIRSGCIFRRSSCKYFNFLNARCLQILQLRGDGVVRHLQ